MQKRGRKPKTEVSQKIEQPKKPNEQKVTINNLMRVHEVASFFDVTERTVYLWLDNGHLEGYRTPGGQLRITRKSVENCRFNKNKID